MVSKVANLFGLPRNYAVGNDTGGYRRIHSPLTTPKLYNLLDNRQAVAVALKNGGENRYDEEMNFAVFDVDNKDDFEETKEVAYMLAVYIIFNMKLPVMVTFSGGKGFHVWVMFERPVSVETVARFQYYIAMECGFTPSAMDEYQYKTTIIETLIAGGQGKVVKIPFSPHQKLSGRYEFPIDYDDILTFDPDAEVDWAKATEILLNTQKAGTHYISYFADKVQDKISTSLGKGKTRRKFEIDTSWLCPDVAPRQDEIMQHILSTPCLQSCFDYSIDPSKKGGYSQRVNIVVALAKAGFTRDEVAVFIRDNINDEEDNANKGVLEYQVGYWYPQTHLCTCANFQDKRKRNFCCPGYCGKNDPSDVGTVFPPAESGKTIMELCNEIMEMPGNIRVFKTTRAGATTSLILAAVEKGQRVIILEPTNELCEKKLSQIMKVAEMYPHIPRFKGIALTDNRSACLHLALKANEIRITHGVEESEFDKFPFATKRQCHKCFYRNYPMEFEEMVPLARSNIQNKECALITAKDRMGEASVIALTYAKFASLLNAVESESEFATEIIGQMLTFDALIFDEFSHFIETPSMDLLLKATWMGGELAYSILDSIRDELRQLRQWNETGTVERLSEYGKEFDRILGKILDDADLDVMMLESILEEDDQLEVQVNFLKYVSPLISFMEDRNMNVTHVLSMLQVIKDVPVAISHIKTIDFEGHISAKKPPLLDATADFVKRFGGKIIVTDATMPLVDPESVLGVSFESFNIGDPQGTAQHTKFFADTWELRTNQLMDATRKTLDVVVNRLMAVFDYYNPNEVFIVAPSILSSKYIRTKLKDQGYPFINMTHQRSDLTIGRDSQFRVMVMVGSPFTPKDAFNWITVFDPDVDPEKAWEWNATKWAFQSASRVKDPKGEIPSVVIGIGIPKYNAEMFFNGKILVNPPPIEPGSRVFEETVVRSIFWKRFETPLNPDESKFATGLINGEDNGLKGANYDNIRRLAGYVQKSNYVR